MTIPEVLKVAEDFLGTALLISLPALVVSLVVGLVVSVLQTITSIQDQTLSYVPRILLVGLAIVVTLGFTLQQAIAFTQRMMSYAAGAGQ